MTADASPMSHFELLPIPPMDTATNPVYSAADLRKRWRALMGPLGFGERLLWFRLSRAGPPADEGAQPRRCRSAPARAG